MTNEWRYQRRRRVRGIHCTFVHIDPNTGVPHGVLCGCGYREPPSRKKKDRIIKRELAKQLDTTIQSRNFDDAYNDIKKLLDEIEIK